MSPPSEYNPLPIFMVQNRICRLRCSPRDARRVRLSQGIRRLCGELMLIQKAVLEARGLKPNLFDKHQLGHEKSGVCLRSQNREIVAVTEILHQAPAMRNCGYTNQVCRPSFSEDGLTENQRLSNPRRWVSSV